MKNNLTIYFLSISCFDDSKKNDFQIEFIYSSKVDDDEL